MFQTILKFATSRAEEVLDITELVQKVVEDNPGHALCSIYARGATAGVMIQENWDVNIGVDFLDLLSDLAPKGRWLHDRIDGNGAAHMKAGLIGPSETIPIADGQLLLSRWQNLFFCEFDGPRGEREVVVTLL